MINILEKSLWKTIVSNMPIPAKDLLIYSEKRGLLMGRRINKPAKNYYFVPGGRVYKNESKNDSIKRIAAEELDLCINPFDSYSIGTYDHFYNDSIWENSKITTHYIVEAILIRIGDNPINLNVNIQHSELKWINQKNLYDEYVHEYSKKYFLDILNLWDIF